MALFKIFKGSESARLLDVTNINYKPLTAGYCYFDTTSKKFYIDIDNETTLTNSQAYKSLSTEEERIQIKQNHNQSNRIPLNAAHADTANAVEGYTAPTSSDTNKVWKTNASGVPGWRNDEAGVTDVEVNGLSVVSNGVAALTIPTNTNLENGSATGSVRNIYSAEEDSISYIIGQYAFAEGYESMASGNYSHAEGYTTRADGYAAHSGGEQTLASKRAQTVIGTYNVEDTSSTTTHSSSNSSYGNYAFIIGNGTSTNSRSNALTVTWSGDLVATKVYNAVWNDYAEWFEKENIEEEFEIGDVCIWDKKGVTKYHDLNDPAVIGVVSNTYGHIIGGESLPNMEDNHKKFVPLGMKGRVKTKIIGKVKKGDLIVTSNVPGHGRVDNRANQNEILGKALEDSYIEESKLVTILV